MNQQQRTITKRMAIVQIEQLGALVEALNAADHLQLELESRNTLISQYAKENEAMRARIQEDEATIQIKDNQLGAAEAQLKDEKLHSEAVKLENIRKSDLLKLYEDAIPCS